MPRSVPASTLNRISSQAFDLSVVTMGTPRFKEKTVHTALKSQTFAPPHTGTEHIRCTLFGKELHIEVLLNI
jgi:hypothetical protein